MPQCYLRLLKPAGLAGPTLEIRANRRQNHEFLRIIFAPIILPSRPLFLPKAYHFLSFSGQRLALPLTKQYKNSVNSLSFRMRLLIATGGVGLLVAAIITGCGQNDVQVYRVGKDQPQQPAPSFQAQAPTMPTGHPDVTSGAPSTLNYKLPAGWQEAPPGQMRVAAFRVQGKDGKQADVGVIPLPGFMGHDLENVNRWRESVGLKTVTEADLAKLAEPVEVAGQPGKLYDQAGENPGSGEKNRLLVAVFQHEGVAWFVKMNGDDELVAQQKPAFVDFLKSVSFPAARAQPELPVSHPPVAGAGLLSAQAPPADNGAQGKPVWQVPAGWQEVAAGQFLVAKFLVTGPDNAKANINISASPGDGGGLLGNVNRWRGQLRLGPLTETDINKLVSQVDTAGGKAMFIDMTGTDANGQKARLLGAIAPESNQTWFYKLMGNEQVVERENDAFSKFVQTAKY